MKSLLILAGTAVLASGAFASTIFDDITGSSLNYTGSTPRGTMGDSFNVGASSSTVTITGMDLAMVFTGAESFTDVTATISFYGTATNAVSGSAAAFQNLLYSGTVDLGAQSSTGASVTLFTDGSFTAAGTTGGITFGSGLTFSTAQNLGVEISFKANSGNGLAYTDGLTSLITYGATPSVGSSNLNGYYRNASNATADSTYALLGSDARSLGQTNQGLGMRFYGSVQPAPEPISTAIVVGALGTAIARRRRNRA